MVLCSVVEYAWLTGPEAEFLIGYKMRPVHPLDSPGEAELEDMDVGGLKLFDMMVAILWPMASACQPNYQSHQLNFTCATPSILAGQATIWLPTKMVALPPVSD